MKPAHIQADGVAITVLRTPTNYTGKAIISKIGKTTADYSVANKRMINCLLASELTTGEIVQHGSDSYLVTMSRSEVIQGTAASIIAYGSLCNTTLTVTRKTSTYNDYGNATGETITTVIDALSCRADVVSSRMRQEDPGLLDDTLLKAYAPYDASLELLDKATIAGNDYQVNHINTLEVPGVMTIQLGAWTGG